MLEIQMICPRSSVNPPFSIPAGAKWLRQMADGRKITYTCLQRPRWTGGQLSYDKQLAGSLILQPSIDVSLISNHNIFKYDPAAKQDCHSFFCLILNNEHTQNTIQ